jgi:uncharacterized protein (TIGR03905 family)
MLSYSGRVLLTGRRKPSIFVKKINYWTIFIIGAVVYGSWLDIDFNRTGSNCLTIMKNNMSPNQYIYHARGVCPPEIHFKIDDGKIKDLRFVGGGCQGNAQLISRLLEDKPLAEVMRYIEGIDCRNETSCPAELACAIQAVQNGTLDTAESFKVQQEDLPWRSFALIGNLSGDNEILEIVLGHIQNRDVDAILCLGNLTGSSPLNRELLKTIRREKIIALQGENDWHLSNNREPADGPKIESRLRDWLLQLPQVLSFKLNSRTGIAFFGDYIQSLAGYSDFEPFALEMNMVCGLTHFMQDKTVFPALEAMIPQFQADIIVFSQMRTWGHWHVGGKDFISVGAALDESVLTWGLLNETNGRTDFKIMKVEP